MLTISIDRNKISSHFKASVSVVSDTAIDAYEARATLFGAPYGRGVGYDLISDDAAAADGAAPLSPAAASFSFDVEAAELPSDGKYRISVYVRDTNGIWNDCDYLVTKTADAVRDSSGAYVQVKRTSASINTFYQSAYTGDEINNFITEALS